MNVTFNPIMKKETYLLDIAGTDSAAMLHRLGGLAKSDPELNWGEWAEIQKAISKRFSALNFAVAGTQKPRR